MNWTAIAALMAFGFVAFFGGHVVGAATMRRLMRYQAHEFFRQHSMTWKEIDLSVGELFSVDSMMNYWFHEGEQRHRELRAEWEKTIQ